MSQESGERKLNQLFCLLLEKHAGDVWVADKYEVPLSVPTKLPEFESGVAVVTFDITRAGVPATVMYCGYPLISVTNQLLCEVGGSFVVTINFS